MASDVHIKSDMVFGIGSSLKKEALLENSKIKMLVSVFGQKEVS